MLMFSYQLKYAVLFNLHKKSIKIKNIFTVKNYDFNSSNGACLFYESWGRRWTNVQLDMRAVRLGEGWTLVFAWARWQWDEKQMFEDASWRNVTSIWDQTSQSLT